MGKKNQKIQQNPLLEVVLSTQERVKVSLELSNLLRRLSQIYPDIEATIFMNLKILTPLMFWFITDSFYFSNQFTKEYLTMMVYRSQQTKDCKGNKNVKSAPENEQSFEQSQQFLSILQGWISDYKNTINTQDIKRTSLNQVIEIAQGNLQVFSDEIDQSFQHIYQQQKIQNQTNQIFIKQHYGIPKKSHPLFLFDQVEDYICSKFKNKFQQSAHIPTCYVCSQPKDLIKCQTCSLEVHQRCYPTLFKKKDKQKKIMKVSSFQCENCRLKIDSENTLCELCCCLGGYFVKYSFSQHETVSLQNHHIQQLGPKSNSHLIFKVSKQPQRKNCFIHLSCLIWNPQVQWNQQIREVTSISKIEKKKLNATCSFCGISFGASVPCTNQTCRRFYHPQCARKNKLQMNFITAKTSVIQLFCNRHRHLHSFEAIAQGNTTKFREVRRLFQAIQKQIKRQNIMPSNSVIKKIEDQSECTACKQPKIQSPVQICNQCRKWTHKICSNYCKNCF